MMQHLHQIFIRVFFYIHNEIGERFLPFFFPHTLPSFPWRFFVSLSAFCLQRMTLLRQEQNGRSNHLPLCLQQSAVTNSNNKENNNDLNPSMATTSRKPIITNSSSPSLTSTTAGINEEYYSSSSSSNTSTNNGKERIANNSSKRYQIDINLATEIGRNLLSKIRSLQQIIHRQEQNITTLQSEKLDLQGKFEALSDRLQSQCENEGIYIYIYIYNSYYF